MLTVSTISHPLLFAPFALRPGSNSGYRETLWAEDNGALRQVPVATDTKSSFACSSVKSSGLSLKRPRYV